MKCGTWCGGVVAALFAGFATLQAAHAEDAAASPAEVVVTATKRETALLDTPISMTVLGSDVLQAVNADDLVLGLDQSAVWGLVRSAQSEFPGRFLLVDLDRQELPEQLKDFVLTGDEPQLAVRGEELLRPRLARFAAGTQSEAAKP